MKKSIFVLLIVLALFFCLGSTGGYEAGKLSLGAFLACSGGSVAVMWASFSAINKIERRESEKNERKKRNTWL